MPAHLTFVPEGRDCHDLEAHAAGFESKAMGNCSFLAAFWGGGGTDFVGGRAIHGSGGLTATDIENLTGGLANPLTIVFVLGSMYDGDTKPDGIDGLFTKELQRWVTENAWTVRRFSYKAEMGRFVVTRSGFFLSKDLWDKKQAFDPKTENSCCCIVM